jgi:hypothetical protein
MWVNEPSVTHPVVDRSGIRATRTLTGHRRSAVKEAAADGKEAVGKEEKARLKDSVGAA